jgi:hypothetical protein
VEERRIKDGEWRAGGDGERGGRRWGGGEGV